MSAPAPAVDATRRDRPAQTGLALGDDDVHVWRAGLDRPAWPLAQLARGLSADERLRADAFVFLRDQWRFIAARGMLRLLLAAYLDCEPGAVALRVGRNGKPELALDSGDPPVRFNYSRSQGGAVYAVTRGRRVGVDLEALRPIPEAEQIAKRWFSAREREALAAMPPEQREGAFLRCWTSKEAYAKAVGDGLSRGLERIEVSLTASEPPTLRAIDGDPVEAAGWSLWLPPPTRGYVAALAVEAHGYLLDCSGRDIAPPGAIGQYRPLEVQTRNTSRSCRRAARA